MNDFENTPWLQHLPDGPRLEGAEAFSYAEDKGPLIIVGDGPSKHRHFEMLSSFLGAPPVMGINRGANDLGLQRLDYLCTMHSDGGTLGKAQVPLTLVDPSTVVIGWKQGPRNQDAHPRVSLSFDSNLCCGTSALLGVLAALYLGYSSIALVGVELSGHYGSERKLEAWRRWAPYWGGKVKSAEGALVPILNGGAK